MKLLKAAFVLGAAPILLGTITLAVWLVTQVNTWERAWIWLIGFMVLCLLAGALCLVRSIRRPQTEPNRRRWPTIAAGALLLLNIPLAVLYMAIVLNIASRYTVEVRNESNRAIDAFLVFGPGVGRVDLAPIPAGKQVEKHFHLTNDGKLEFSMRQGGQASTGMLEPSAGPGCGGRRVVTVKRDGVCEVEKLHPVGAE